MTTAPTRPLNHLVTGFWSRAAVAYDFGPLQATAYRPPQDEVLSVLRVAGARTVVDVACGTGILTSRIAAELDTDRVYGVDMSAGMLAKARARSATVDWRTGPAEQLPLPDEAVDAVVTTSAFHFFNQPAALLDFHRVLRPGGLAVISSIDPTAVGTRVFANWALAHGESPLASSPSPDRVREMVADAGLRLVESRKVRRPMPAWLVPDRLTVAKKPGL